MILAEDKKYDVFISHAGEDETVAKDLAVGLTEHGLRVWLDKVELTVGDNLLEKIDQGLSKSRFGVVILSPAFFANKWTNLELGGLFAKENGREKVILPVWHRITHDKLTEVSPILAGRLAVSTEIGIELVAKEILCAIRPEIKLDLAQRTETLFEHLKAKALTKIRERLLTGCGSEKWVKEKEAD